MNLPINIALNGPPGSGKSWIARYILKMIPDAIYVQPIHEGYTQMQEEGLAPKGMLYDDFKRLPDSRAALIKASGVFRARDYNFFERRITDSEAYRNARVVVIDNVGHTESEFPWYDLRSKFSILVRLDTPFQEVEPMKSRARRLKAIWESDSRSPVTHHSMLTAYDSRQMVLLLDWLSRPLTPQETGPYNGIKSLWDHCLRGGVANTAEPARIRDAQTNRSSGLVGGLGKQVKSQPESTGVWDDSFISGEVG
jgi:hypothetical protein